jgi:hypothetical protein
MNCTNVSSTINIANLGVKILKPYAGCRFLENNCKPTDNFNITYLSIIIIIITSKLDKKRTFYHYFIENIYNM